MTAWADGLVSALAEAVVIGRLVSGIAGQVDPNLPVVWAFPLAVAAHLAGQLAATLAARRSEDGDRRALLAFWLGPWLALGALVVRAFDHIGFGGVLIAMLTWTLCSARGVSGVTQPRGSEAVRGGLIMGTVILGSLSMVGLDGGVPATVETLVFLLLGSALSILRRRREVAQRVSVQERTPWAAGGLGFVALVLLAVMVLYGVGTGGFGTLVRILTVCRDYIAVALGYALTPLAYVVQWLILRLQRLVVGRETEGLQMPGSLGEELAKQMEENPELVGTPEWVKWSGLALLLIIVVGIAWLLVSRFYRRTRGEDTHERRASLVGGGALKEWLDDLADGLADMASQAVSKLRSLVGGEPMTLHEIYTATLALLARRGIPREPHFTPFEYCKFATEEMPNDEAKGALARITNVFTECHYAEREPHDEELKSMKDAYRQLAESSFSAVPGAGQQNE